ncbi:hypothetical protein [Algibacter mikhailovii]|nr:hypothetical protein [Algibacter mikhailovii]
MKTLVKCLFVVALFFMACQENDISNSPTEEVNSLNLDKIPLLNINTTNTNIYSKSTEGKTTLEDFVAAINSELLEENLQLSTVELLGHKEAGITYRFKAVGNKQLLSDWIPDDPRNYLPGTNLLYWVDGTELATTSGMSGAETLGAIDNAMNTWGSVSCSKGLNTANILVTTPNLFGDVGIAQKVRGFGGAFNVVYGSILFGGNLPKAFFNTLRPNGGNNIIAVTFTWVFLNEGTPTDLDNNGKNDVAFKEIYFNDSMPFQDEPNDIMDNGIIDFETVAIHEAGHGLSQAHFGKSFTKKNGKIQYAPFAIMNAGYSLGQRDLLGTDKAGHCSMWSNWPKK